MIESIKRVDCATSTIKKVSLKECKKTISFGNDFQEISKALAEASKNNFVAQNNVQKKEIIGKKISIDDIPKDWSMISEGKYKGIYDKGGIKPDDSYVAFLEYNNPTPELIREYVQDEQNIGKCIDLYHRSKLTHPTGAILHIDKIGALYVEKDGSMTCYTVKDVFGGKDYSDVDEFYLSCIYDGDRNKQYSAEDIVVGGLLKDGRINEAYKLFERIETKRPNIRKIQIDYLISRGREDEARERFPREIGYINDIVNSINLLSSQYIDTKKPLTVNDYLAKGDLKGAVLDYNVSLPYPLNSQSEETLFEIADYIKDNNLLEKWAQEYKKASVAKAEGVLDNKPEKKVYWGLATLGISEAINKLTRQYNKLGLIKTSNGKIRQKRELVNLTLLHMLKAKEAVIPEKKAYSKTILNVEDSKEPAKILLQQRLLDQIRGYKKNKNVDVPNCVMLTGENPYVVRDIMMWIKANCEGQTNFVELSSKKDKAQMQEDILNALETAEENYKKTKERSVIFVNGMEKLLRPDFNESEDIAVMKDFMSSASEDYHSTIVFYAKEPEKLDPGTVVSHRVGLKINVPDHTKYSFFQKGEKNENK